LAAVALLRVAAVVLRSCPVFPPWPVACLVSLLTTASRAAEVDLTLAATGTDLREAVVPRVPVPLWFSSSLLLSETALSRSRSLVR